MKEERADRMQQNAAEVCDGRRKGGFERRQWKKVLKLGMKKVMKNVVW